MDPHFSSQYEELQKRHWWFRARIRILKTLIAQLDWTRGLRVMELGVGPGENLYTLYPQGAELVGVESDEENAAVAQRRGNVPVYIGTAENLPESIAGETFDVIAMFDVLEHIKDDVKVLKVLRERLRDQGHIVLTVPTYMWMWGPQDIVSRHYRRYTVGGLSRKLNEAGFRVVHRTYFNTLLFPAIALWRLIAKVRPIRPEDVHSDFDYSFGPVNEMLYRILAAEAPLLRHVRFFFGVSAFVMAVKEGASTQSP